MNASDFKTRGVRVGQIFRIDVWVHWALLLLLLYQLYQIWIESPDWVSLALFGLWTLAIFLTIFPHELGHCYAAHRMGGGADAIVLWPLGGLAEVDAPNLPRAQFWVAIGGPLVNLATIGVLIPLILALSPTGTLLDRSSPWVEGYFVVFLRDLLEIEVFVTLFNLVPVYPLDGGRIFQALVWGRTGSYGRATMITVWASRISIGAVLIASFFPPMNWFGPLTLCILIWALLKTEQLRLRAREDEQDYVFGYDFSRGYTSLERTLSPAGNRSKRPSLLERVRRRRAARREQRRVEMREEVDRLLDKISREGMTSLSRRERRFLEQASRELGHSS